MSTTGEEKPLWKVLEEITPPECCEIHKALADALDKTINPTRAHVGTAPLPYQHCARAHLDGLRPAPDLTPGGAEGALREAREEAGRLRGIVEAVAAHSAGPAGRLGDLWERARAALRPAGTPPDLTSLQTFEITGRGTIKVIHPDKLPKGYVLKVGDPVRIDGQDWRCVGIESHRHKDGSIGVLVRPAGALASIPPDSCDGDDR